MDNDGEEDPLKESCLGTSESELETDEEIDDGGDGGDMAEEGEEAGSGPNSEEDGSDSGGEEDGFSSDDSNGNSEKCPICLQRFTDQEIGVPDNCEHHFCLLCISQWAKKVTTCPIDRKSFNSIMVKADLSGDIVFIEDVTSRDVTSVNWDEPDLDPTYCEHCGHSDREDRLLLCDGCDLGFHLECLEPPLEFVPIEDWYCPQCQLQRNTNREPQPSTSNATSTRQSNLRVPRTSLSRRIMQQRRTLNSDIKCIQKPKTVGQTQQSRSVRGRTTKRRKPRRKYKMKGGKRVYVKSRRRKTRRTRRAGTGTKNPNRCRVAQQMKPSTTKGRLAQNLGLILPRSGQPLIGLPSYRLPKASPQTSANGFPSRRKRNHDGIVPHLSLFGSPHNLSECFETVSDDEGGGSVGIVRTQPISRIGIPRKPSLVGSLRNIEPLHLSTTSNVLGPILSSQQRLHMSVPISRDKTESNDQWSPLRNGESRIPSPTAILHVPFLTATGGGGNSASNVSPGVTNPTSTSSSTTCHNTGDSVESSNNSGSGDSSLNPAAPAASGTNDLNHNSSDGMDGLGSSQFLYPLFIQDKMKEDKEKEATTEKPDDKTTVEEDDYNIYSDIEEDPRDENTHESIGDGDLVDSMEVPTQVFPVPQDADQEQDRERNLDSDSDMVIDEQAAGAIGSTERESRSSVESLTQTAPTLTLSPKPNEIPVVEKDRTPDATPSKEVESASVIVINSDSDSQESIPLPDTTPPPSVQGKVDDDVVYLSHEIKRKSVVRKDEYDPSQPLTSSDDDDDEVLQLSPPIKSSENRVTSQPFNLKKSRASEQPKNSSSNTSKIHVGRSSPTKPTSKIAGIPSLKLQPPKEGPASGNPPNSKDAENSESEDVDLSSIPMPSDEYRRPTIQFSIPTRHRLIPISSLIKRQKGVMRKEAKAGESQSFQSEISKAFGTEREEEEEEDETEFDTPTSKEGDDAPTPQKDQQPSPEKVSLVAEIFGSDNEEEEEEKQGLNKPLIFTEIGVENLADSTPEPILVLAKSPPTISERDSSAESRWKQLAEDKENTNVTGISLANVVESNPPTSIPGLDGDECKESTQQKAKAHVDSQNNESSTHDPDKKARKEREPVTKDGEKKQKRKRSESPNRSNFEEGEIEESPIKRKRKPRKTKKSKHRRRSHDGSDTSRDELSEQGAELGPLSSSSDDEGRSSIPWKKPSKSTKERNYRDGKPKTEEKFFREKDKRANEYSERRKRPNESHEGTSSQKLKGRDKEKEKGNVADSRRGHKRSSKSRSKSPLPWRSKSRSLSKSRAARDRRKSNSSSPNKSNNSRSPTHAHSRSPRSRRWKQRRRHSVSPRRGFRSRSRGRTPQRLKSRSPAKRTRSRRSRSLSSREKKGKSKRRSASSSTISERSVSSRTKTRRRGGVEDRTSKKGKREKEKEKDKISEKPSSREQTQAKEKEKDKKRRKKRREKSASPAKEIFADGDSIVVSLNFQKGKDNNAVSSTNPTKESSASGGKHDNDAMSEQKKRKGKHSRKSSERDSVAKPLKKTILIDLETSPIQEQNIGVSPTLIVLSDDEESMLDSSGTSPSKSGRNKDGGMDRDGIAVSTTTVGAMGEINTLSPSYRHNGHGVPADSTQIQTHQSDSQHLKNLQQFSKNLSVDDGSSSSPTRGDSVVTSTRDSLEVPLPHDEDTLSPPTPPHSDTRLNAPTTPPLPPGTPPPKEKVAKVDNSLQKEASSLKSAPTMPMGQNLPLSLPPPPGMNLGLGCRPIGIGNIPGLFPSSNPMIPTSNMSGIPSISTPIVIPTPPPPQIRYNQVLNANVLSVLNNALYGPFLAAKQLQQQQQTMGGRFPSMQMQGSSSGTVNRAGDRSGPQGSVLLPKNQNSHSMNRRDGGDSPFSPNSSEGDDLFEPPTDKPRSPRDRPHTSNIGYGGTNKDRPVGGGPASSSAASGQGLKGKSTKLFDSLFGGTPVVKKPNPAQPTFHQNKTRHLDKGFKSKGLPHHKQRGIGKRVLPKKEITKNEGELRLTEDVPTSAVQLQVSEKFLKKLNRQERVVEEVKLSLKPHYSKKHVDKDEYKEILRRAVPKICHNKSGEINPFKIKELIEAYVKKFRKNRKPW